MAGSCFAKANLQVDLSIASLGWQATLYRCGPHVLCQQLVAGPQAAGKLGFPLAEVSQLLSCSVSLQTEDSIRHCDDTACSCRDLEKTWAASSAAVTKAVRAGWLVMATSSAEACSSPVLWPAEVVVQNLQCRDDALHSHWFCWL